MWPESGGELLVEGADCVWDHKQWVISPPNFRDERHLNKRGSIAFLRRKISDTNPVAVFEQFVVSTRSFSQPNTKCKPGLSLDRDGEMLPKYHSADGMKLDESEKTQFLSKAQELICNFFLKAVKQDAPETVLQSFKRVFIELTVATDSIPQRALSFIGAAGSEETYINTLKRSIYILVNNWNATRQQEYLPQLVQLLSTTLDAQKIGSVTSVRLQLWRRNFINSQDYQELQLFASKYDTSKHRQHWSERYSSYLFACQSVDASKPLEQQEAARTYSKQLKEQFKLNLAMYTARAASATCPNNTSPNPTSLGEHALDLIQELLKKRDRFSYASLARIFLSQAQPLRYKDFKPSLLNYLFYALGDGDLIETIRTQLTYQLDNLYQTYDHQAWDNSLLLRTCNRLIEYLTTVNRETPSPLFIILATQGEAMTLAILLLKIVLLCPATHTHLESCLGQLIQHYKIKAESECKWLVHFLEVVQLTLTLYAENVRYNLVKMSEYQPESSEIDEKTIYRIFSQLNDEAQEPQKVA